MKGEAHRANKRMRLTIPPRGFAASRTFLGRHESVSGWERVVFKVCGVLECVIGTVVADGCVAAGGGCGGASGCIGRQLALGERGDAERNAEQCIGQAKRGDTVGGMHAGLKPDLTFLRHQTNLLQAEPAIEREQNKS